MNTAPPLHVSQWLNTTAPIDLARLRGSVVLIEAFQMLCPGCVSHGLPQAQRVRQAFPESDVAVIGLHCVFEHHDVQTPLALSAFLHEYRVTFPVAVDEPDEHHGIPRTMSAYKMQGTPTLILIDKTGRRRFQHFGHVPDLQLGAQVMALIAESTATTTLSSHDVRSPAACDAGGCTPQARKEFFE